MSFSRSGAAPARVEPLKRGTAEQRMRRASGHHRSRRAEEQLDSGLDELTSMSSGVLDDIASLQALMVEQGIEGGQPGASSASAAPAQRPPRQDPAARARDKEQAGSSFVDVLARCVCARLRVPVRADPVIPPPVNVTSRCAHIGLQRRHRNEHAEGRPWPWSQSRSVRLRCQRCGGRGALGCGARGSSRRSIC